MDANAWSRNRAGQPREANKFNQFGYILSGPIYLPGRLNADRSKLFFLFAQEWVKHRQDVTSIQTVPSLAMRRGDFSELLSPTNTFFGRVRVVNDPTTGTPFPNNVIPPSVASPNGLGFLRAYPEPVPGFLQGTSNFIQTRPQPTNQRKDTVSVDFSPVAKHYFRFRHQNYSFKQLDAFPTGFDRAPMVWDRPNKVASLNHIWTVSPTTVNEFLVTASVDRVRMDIQREGERYSRTKYGISYPYIFPRGKLVPDRIPTVDIANFGTLDGNYPPVKSAGPIYVISNSTTKVRGNHSFKFGVSFEYSGQNDFDQISTEGVPGGSNNQNGRFVFSDTRSGATSAGLAVANAAMGLFNTYAEIGERSYTPYRGQMFEWFVQDSWKATPKLRLELGVRHTLQTPFWYSLWGNIAVFDPKHYDPAKAVVQDPRTGYILRGDQYNGVTIPGKGWPAAAKGRVAIADTGEFDRLFSGGKKSWGQFQKLDLQPRLGVAYSINTKTVVRSGVGRFFPRPGMSGDMLLGGNPPFQPMASIANGQADNPSSGQPAQFPFYFMTIEPVFKNPSAYNWNFTVEREVGFDTTVSAAYVGRVGLHLERQRDINQLPVGTTHNPANKGINVNVLRPYKGFASIAMRETATRSKYDSLQIEVNRRFTKGLSYGIAYTYSKCMDNASNFRARVYNAYDDRNYWGMCDTDRRHVAVANFIYELPFLRNRSTLAGRLLGGWQASGVMQFQTGTPVTIGTGDDFAGIGSTDLQPWEVSGNPKLPRDQRKFSQGAADSNFFFRTRDAAGNSLFTQPALSTFSATQKRNSLLHGPGSQSWNLAGFKNFAISEKHTIQFRAEFFNWPNHPNWGGVTTNPKSATFGKVTGKTGNRTIQLSLRYNF